MFVDTMLPFGLRSAPKILNAVADTVQWQLEQRGLEHIDHYLDDFIVWEPPGATTCQDALNTMVQCCAQLGIPLATHKTVGPSSQLTF